MWHPSGTLTVTIFPAVNLPLHGYYSTQEPKSFQRHSCPELAIVKPWFPELLEST